MAWENLSLSLACSLGRGSLWQFSPGRVARVPGLDISILQGQMYAEQMELLLLRKRKSRWVLWLWGEGCEEGTEKEGTGLFGQ